VEEHSIIGGMGSAVAEVLSERCSDTILVRMAVGDLFGESGEPYELFKKYHLTDKDIVKTAESLV
jgi:transketolase